MYFKHLIRSLAGGLIRPLAKIYTNNKLTVFCYHDISNEPSEFSHKNGLNVPPNIFDYQIDYIKKNFNIIGPDHLLDGRIPKNAAVITFDDGFKSYFTTAIPILMKYKLPSINFLNMATIKGEISWSGLINYLSKYSPEFIKHVTNNTDCDLNKRPLFLYCSRYIVNSFLTLQGKSYKKEVDSFVGNIGTEKDLASVASNNLVFFGNHLYNHDVPSLLSDNELLESFNKNKNELVKYPNYRNMFAFPFGAVAYGFLADQIKLLIENGVSKIFSSFPVLNYDRSGTYLTRIPLHSFCNSRNKIIFQLYYKNIFNQLGHKWLNSKKS